MAGFSKPKAEQAALKLGVYGPQGSGKTFTALLIAEGLSKHYRKKVGFVDTEHGTDFYVKHVRERQIHPEPFDIEPLYTRSITDVIETLETIPPDIGIVVIDSITHIWEACINAYSGNLTSKETIPFQAWGTIKKPYKRLMAILLSSKYHVIICGRQGNEFGKDEDGDLTRLGYKMKAEGETPYEPHILIRLEPVKDPRTNMSTITAVVEKDRTGILAGKVIANPTFDTIAKPMLPLFGDSQAKVEDPDETAVHDAERLAEQERAKTRESAALLKEFSAKMELCKTAEELKAIAETITPEIKKRMTTSDTSKLKEVWIVRESELKQ